MALRLTGRDRFTYLTETPVRRLILTLAVPTIISMLVTGLYNMADTYFVGRISTQATAAVGVVFPLMSIIQSLGFFCGQGSGNYVSRKLGAGDRTDAKEMASTGFALAFLIGVVFCVICRIFAERLALLMGALPSFMDSTLAYMNIILLGSPFMMSQLTLNNQLRFQGNAFYSMIGLVSGAVLNIGLDPLLMFTFGMGVAGAALATIISQMVSFTVLLIGDIKVSEVAVDLHCIRFNRHYLLEIVNGGTPSLARQGLGSISAVLLNTYAGMMGGDAAIAGMSVVTRTMMLAMSALIGFGQGFQPVCSFNYGAKKYRRVRDGYWFCVKYGTLFLLLLAVPGFIFAPQVIGFFRDDPAVIEVGKTALRFQACVFPLNGFIIMSNMMLQSMGKGVRGTLLASFRSGLFMIPSLLILSSLLGLLGVQMAQTVSDALTFAAAIPLVAPVLLLLKADKAA